MHIFLIIIVPPRFPKATTESVMFDVAVKKNLSDDNSGMKVYPRQNHVGRSQSPQQKLSLKSPERIVIIVVVI